MAKTITIDPVTRIEGHARILLECNDAGGVDEAYFIVNELRGFERILVGMEAHTMPQITARICGVCPTAHHLASAKALDNAAGVEPPPGGRLMRELMYMGHLIHSHCLSLFVLAGPDLVFGLQGAAATQNIVGMVDANPELTKKALRLRSLGQKLNEVVGGRGIHPVTALAGGTAARLSDAHYERVREISAEALILVKELAPVTKELLLKLLAENPVLLDKLNVPSWYLGTVNGGKLNLYDGDLRAMDENGVIRAEFETVDYANYLVERAVKRSYAKEVYLNVDGAEHMYRVSTLARMNVADSMETPLAQKEFEEFRNRFGRPCHNAVLQMYCKLVELVYVCEKAVEIVHDPALRGAARVPANINGSRGIGHVEAPRGVLIHDYKIDQEGIIRAANMIVATQQNTAAINKTLKEGAVNLLAGNDDEKLLNGLEFVVRCYDPCLACSTHAVGRMELDVEIAVNGETIRRIRRSPSCCK